MFITKNNHINWSRLGIGALVTGALVAMGIAWFDKPLFLFLRQFDCGLWGFFDTVFDAKKWIVVAAIVLVVFYLKKALNSGVKYKNDRNYFNLWAFMRDFEEKTKHSDALFILCSVALASFLAKGLKIVIGRARPIFFEALDMTGFFPFNTEWAFNSMPSGHTVASFAALVMLGMLHPRLKPLTWTLAIVIGVSRVCIGAHWPSDVIFGAFIGMVMADIVMVALRYRASDAR